MEHAPREHSKKPRFVRWAVMVGIVVALNVFFLVARTYILQAPQYETYCPMSVAAAATTTQACSAAGGIWNETSLPNPDPKNTSAPQGYCDLTTKCQPQYQAAFDHFQLYSFILEVGLGLLAIIVGVLPLGASIVSTGLTYGGVVAFIIAAAQYWSDAGNLLRLLISVLALGTLIYIGLKRFKD